ncbi:MAG: ribulose-phosphate 3-epimerase [Pirellulaceae bacterium]|nr:MAG: ribulose-phosphate 3-epimerase [Pirellulaceae bacterium]
MENNDDGTSSSEESPGSQSNSADGSVCDRLRAARPAILPSLLLCDFAHLADEIHRLEAAGVPALHLDVMDGHFVPNLTYGMPIVAAIRRVTRLPLDVHLMISRPERYVAEFIEAGADVVTVHAEAVERAADVLSLIRRRGAAAGLAFNPGTSLKILEKCADCVDLVLIMSVMAGFGGQAFQPIALDRLRWVRDHLPSHVLLEVDGGINQQTISACAEAGAELFVVGSAIFRSEDYRRVVSELAALAGREVTKTEQDK